MVDLRGKLILDNFVQVPPSAWFALFFCPFILPSGLSSPLLPQGAPSGPCSPGLHVVSEAVQASDHHTLLLSCACVS